MKPIQVRCSKSLKTKKGRQVRCDRFIAKINNFEIAIKCRNCGTWYHVSREATGEYHIVGSEAEKHSENLNKEPQNETY